LGLQIKPAALIQARMKSSRLPGKVLMDLQGQKMLERVYKRTAQARCVDKVVILTSSEPADDPVEVLCQANGWLCHRGSEDDVLDRYYQAAGRFEADPIVRITGDCPLIDPDIIDRAVCQYATEVPQPDYVSNAWPHDTFPRGLDVEVLRLNSLETAWREASEKADREHVTLFIYRNPGRFHISGFSHLEDLSHMRWTVDTHEDMEFVRAVYSALDRDDFRWTDVLGLLKKFPELSRMNQHIVQINPR
jgi:spore coat polysaccharide biosynthesis protein SpsF